MPTENDQGEPHDAGLSPLHSIPSPVPLHEQHSAVTPFGIGVWLIIAIFVIAVVRRLLRLHK